MNVHHLFPSGRTHVKAPDGFIAILGFSIIYKGTSFETQNLHTINNPGPAGDGSVWVLTVLVNSWWNCRNNNLKSNYIAVCFIKINIKPKLSYLLNRLVKMDSVTGWVRFPTQIGNSSLQRESIKVTQQHNTTCIKLHCYLTRNLSW